MDRLVLKSWLCSRRLADSISDGGEGHKWLSACLCIRKPVTKSSSSVSWPPAIQMRGFDAAAMSTQLLSFNNPQGACPECGGLGVKQFFDEKSDCPGSRPCRLYGGAIAPWGWRNESTYTGQMLAAVAKHYGFSHLRHAVSINFRKNTRKIILSRFRGTRRSSSITGRDKRVMTVGEIIMRG